MKDYSINDRAFDPIVVGEELPSLVKVITPKLMMSYCAATWDYAPIHYDVATARDFGFSAPIADGQMFGSFLVQLVQNWAGHYAHIQTLKFQNKKVSFSGDQIVCKGYVENKCENERSIICKLWIETDENTIILDECSAVILFRGTN